MEFHGNNAALGTEQVALTDRRTADIAIQPTEDQPLFPNGLAGLVPIRTLKANGSESITYTFPFGEGIVGEDASDYYGDDIPVVEVTDEQKPVLDALLSAIDMVNDLLVQASELSNYTFGQVCAIQVGVTELGVGFTRVEPFPTDKDKAQNYVALTLHIETTDAMPGTTESFSAVVDYDRYGDPIRIAMLEYDGDGYVFRAAADLDDETERLTIRKVELINRATKSERLLYMRGLRNREDDRRGERDNRRTGRDNRRGSSRDDRGGQKGKSDQRNEGRPRGRRSGR